MTEKEVLQAVRDGKTQQGWAIFRFNPLMVIITLLGWVILDLLFAAGATALLYNYFFHPTDKTMIYTGGFLAVMTLFFFIPIFNRLRALLFARGSMVVITPERMVRYYCGKTIDIPRSDITNLKLVWQTGRGFPQSYVECIDRRSNRFVEIARNRTFGPAQTIYNHLLENCT